jgi:hypothetical protein
MIAHMTTMTVNAIVKLALTERSFSIFPMSSPDEFPGVGCGG